jgi:hypothetical protein
MRGTNEEIRRLVEDELRRRPAIPDGILFALALQIDPELERMDPRTFHAHYVVPARQAVIPQKRRKRKPRPSGQTPAPAATRGRARRSGLKDVSWIRSPLDALADDLKSGPALQGSEAESGAAATTSAAGPAAAPAPPRRSRAVRPRAAAAPARSVQTPPPSAETGESPESPALAAHRGGRPERDRVRAALLAFAVELAAAERPAELVMVFERIGTHVDRAVGAGPEHV